MLGFDSRIRPVVELPGMNATAPSSRSALNGGWKPILLSVFVLTVAWSAAASAPATLPASGIVELTELEWQLWQVTAARPGRLWEDVTYIMLSKTAAIPSISDQRFAELDRPAYQTLLSDPLRYVRLPVQPVGLTVRVGRVRKLLPGKGEMGFSRHWPRERPVWRIECLNAAAEKAADQPLIVLSTVDPMPLLPKPSGKAGREGSSIIAEYKGTPPHYKQLPVLELAGIFFKVHRTEAKEVERDYPVVLAWQLRKGASGAGMSTLASAVLLFIVVAAAAAFFLLRRGIKRSARERAERHVLRRAGWQRAEMTGEEAAGEEKGEVDSDLKAAVEQYRKEKEAADGKDDNS